jgi:hypothetical protein
MRLPSLDHRWRPAILAIVLTTVTGSACFIVRQVSVVEVDRAADSVRVETPVKAHLLDGSTVVYRKGVLLAAGRLRGTGTRYDLRLANPLEVNDLPVDSLVGLESYRTTINGLATLGASTLAVVGALGITVAIACATDPKCFGSCPTFYGDSAGTPVLEAEGFSYSIAPLFEARDVDRLRSRPVADTLRIEVRNEAFETHFTNHLELLEATHAPDEFVGPDPDGHPIAVAGQGAPLVARDRSGRDVRGILTDADGRTYATAKTVMAAVTDSDYQDRLEVAFAAPEGPDSIALVLRLRNSLLNTVLLYDMMLGDPGARSLDWQATELDRIGPALQLATWYASHMGLGIEIWRDGTWTAVRRLKDTGPVAWKDVVVPLPRVPGDSVRIRLVFPADNWRIDRIALASRIRRPSVRALSIATVTALGGAAEPAALASLSEPDGRYLETGPGQGYVAKWAVGPESPGATRTFLLASQGYYTEWVRQTWITAARDTTTFHPSEASISRAIGRWRQAQDTLERRFFATRVPVR